MVSQTQRLKEQQARQRAVSRRVSRRIDVKLQQKQLRGVPTTPPPRPQDITQAQERQELQVKLESAKAEVLDAETKLQKGLSIFENRLSSIERDISYRLQKGDTTTAAFLSAEKSGTLEAIDEVKNRLKTIQGLKGQSFISTSEFSASLKDFSNIKDLGAFIARKRSLASFAFKPKPREPTKVQPTEFFDPKTGFGFSVRSETEARKGGLVTRAELSKIQSQGVTQRELPEGFQDLSSTEGIGGFGRKTVIEPVEEPKGILEKVRRKISKEKGKVDTDRGIFGEAKLTGLGVISVPLDIAASTEPIFEVIKKGPIETFKKIPREVSKLPGLIAGFGTGLLAKGKDVGQFLISSPGKVESPFKGIGPALRTDPSFFIGEAVGEVALVYGGGKVLGKIIPNKRLTGAIDRSFVSSKTTGEGVDILRKYKSVNVKVADDLKTLTDKGFRIREIEQKLVATSTKDAKIIPNVRSRFVEVVNREGRVVEVVRVGEFVIETGTKTYTQNILSQALGKVSEGKTQMFQRTLRAKPIKKALKPIEEVKTFTETIVQRKKVSKLVEKVEFEADTALFSIQKFPKTARKLKIEKFGLEVTDLSKIDPSSVSAFLKKIKDISSPAKQFSEGTLFLKTEALALKKTDIGKMIGGLDVKFGEKFTAIKGTKEVGGFVTFKKGLPMRSIKEARKQRIKDLQAIKKAKQIKEPKLKLKVQDLKQQSKQIQQNLESIFAPDTEAISLKAFTQDVLVSQPRVGLRAISASLQETRQLAKLAPRIKTDQQQRQVLKTLQGTQPGLITGEKLVTVTKPALKTRLAIAPALAQVPKLAQPQKLITGTTFPGVTTPPIPMIVPVPPIGMFFLPRYERDRQALNKRLNEPVNVFVKSKGQFRKVTKNPITRRQGLDLGGSIVDKTLSRQFSIRKAKGKVKQPSIKTPFDFFSFQRHKFRSFKRKKGQRILLQDRFIERKKYIGDTASEIGGLNVERFLAQKRSQGRVRQTSNKRLKKLFFPFFK